MTEDTARLEIDKYEQMVLGSGCFALGKIARAITQLYDRILAPLGLCVTELGILRVCAAAGSISATDLARELMTNRMTVARGSKPLVAAGLIRHLPLANGQKEALLELTPLGLSALAEAVVKWEQAQRDLIDQIGEARWYRLKSELAEFAGMKLDSL